MNPYREEMKLCEKCGGKSKSPSRWQIDRGLRTAVYACGTLLLLVPIEVGGAAYFFTHNMLPLGISAVVAGLFTVIGVMVVGSVAPPN